MPENYWGKESANNPTDGGLLSKLRWMLRQRLNVYLTVTNADVARFVLGRH